MHCLSDAVFEADQTPQLNGTRPKGWTVDLSEGGGQRVHAGMPEVNGRWASAPCPQVVTGQSHASSSSANPKHMNWNSLYPCQSS